MNQKIKYIGLLALLPLLTVPLTIDYAVADTAQAKGLGEVAGFAEESIVNTPGFQIELVSGEELPIAPIIGIIGIEQ